MTTEKKISELTLVTTVAEADLSETERVADGVGCRITHANKRLAYFSHATSLALKVGGSDRLTVTTSNVTSTLPILVPDGGVASSVDSGNAMFFLGATDEIGWKTNGTNRLSLTTTALNSTLPILPVTDNAVALGSATKRWTDGFFSGDLVAAGGFRSFLGPFGRDNLGASVTDGLFGLGTSAASPVDCGVGRAGSIVGITCTLTVAPAGSNPVIQIWKAGATGAFSAIASCTLTITAGANLCFTTTFAKDTFTFAANDRLQPKVTTNGSWTATTSDLAVFIEVEQ